MIGERQEQPGEDDAERIQPAEEGDDDGGEAVARRDAGLELADRPRHFEDAGKAGERARDREGEQHQAIGAEAGEARRPAARRRRTLISKPMIVRPSSTAASMTTTSANTEPACRRPAPTNRVGSVATPVELGGGGKLKPCGSRHGPRTS